jgi:nicotinamidase-related amidase
METMIFDDNFYILMRRFIAMLQSGECMTQRQPLLQACARRHPISAPQRINMNTAVLVIDMQNDFVLPGAPLCVSGAKDTIPAIAQLLNFARTMGWTVVHVIRQHEASGCDAEPFRRHLFENGSGFCVKGTHGAEIVDELQPKSGDYQVVKTRFSGFFKTELHQLLQRLGIKQLILAGTQYPNCIRATAVDAISLGYKTIVCTDACSAASPKVATANIYDLGAHGNRLCLTNHNYYT